MSLVHAERDGTLGVVTLSRAERHNSLVPELLEDLIASLDLVTADPAVRCVVLEAEGGAFSTGGDLTEIRRAEDRAAYADRLVGLLNEAILRMLGSRLPIVTAVHGIVTGGSLGLLLGSDVVVMAEEATIRPWYTTVGFAPDGGWTALLPGVIGRRRAAAVLLADATITAVEALAWGLVHRVVPAAEVGCVAGTVAESVAAGSPDTVGAVRRLLGQDLDRAAAALEAERRAFVEVVMGDRATGGMDAFLEGRLR